MTASRKTHWTRLPVVDGLVYLVFRSTLTLLQILGSRSPRGLGRFLGRLLRRFDRRHVGIARRNLDRSDLRVEGGREAFLDRLFGQVGLTLAELAMMPRRISAQGFLDDFRQDRTEGIDRVLSRKRGLIVAVGHCGNYELGGLAVARRYPLNSLARTLPNARIDRYVTRLRARTGARLIPSHGALKEMIRVLQRGEILVVEIDQDAKKDGVLVPFFGRSASTHRSAALLSVRYGAPVILVDVFRDGGRNVCVFSDPVEPDRFKGDPEPVDAMTAHLTAELERSIRAHPDQWWWFLERWRGAEKRSRLP